MSRTYKRRAFKDVFYQTINVDHVHEVGESYHQTSFELPIPRGSYLPRGKQMIIEVIEARMQVLGNMETDKDCSMSLFTRDPSALVASDCRLGNPAVFLTWYKKSADENPAGYPIMCEDQRGNGKIVAVDRMYFKTCVCNHALTPTAPAEGSKLWCSCRIRYRWRVVDTSEYVGIVQSQVE